MKWSLSLPSMDLTDTPWLVLGYRAQNLERSQGDYLVYLRHSQSNREWFPLKPSALESDGRDHLLAVDLSALTDQPAADLVAIQAQANQAGQARLWLSIIGFSEIPPAAARVVPTGSKPTPQPPWMAPLAGANWVAQPSWLANPAQPDACSGSTTGGVTRLQVATPGRGMKWCWTLPAPVASSGHRYVTIRYRAQGVSAAGHYALCFMGATPSKSDAYEVALPSSEIVADGRWHTACARLDAMKSKLTQVTALACELQAARPEAWLEIQGIRLTNESPQTPFSDACAWKAGAVFAGFAPLLLEPSALRDGARWIRQAGLTQWPETNRLTAEGIPFQLTEGEPRFAVTPLKDKADLRIPVQARASEVYLLVLAKFRGAEEPVYGEGRFRAIHDVDRFRLRLEYADASVEECLPLDAATRQFGLVGGAQVLVAAADASKTLRAVVVRDLSRQAAAAVVALTARVDGKRGFPEALEETPPLRVAARQAAFSTEPQLALSGTTLSFRCGSGNATVQLNGVPCWSRLQDPGTKWDYLSSPSPLFELSVDGVSVASSNCKPQGLSLAPRSPGGAAVCQADYSVDGFEGLSLSLIIEMDPPDSLAMRVAVTNRAKHPRRVSLVTPRIGPYRLSENAEAAHYLVPKRGAALDHRSYAYHERYCGLFPLQFLDTFNPSGARGLSLRTEDTSCTWKHYVLEKKGGELYMAVAYPERVLNTGEGFETPRAVLSFNGGSWRRGFEAYRNWLASWYRPLTPRQSWFREVFNFRQRFLHGLDPLCDGRHLNLQRAVDEAQREFGGLEYLHLFDWGDCGPYGRIYGRRGDYSPFDYLPGGQAALRQAMAGVQAKGIPVGLYIEGYLLDERGRLGQRSGKDWQLVDAAGQGARWPNSSELVMCSRVEPWREVQASTYAEKARELKPNGMYIDEFGFAGSNFDCWSSQHGHGRPAYAVAGERELTRRIRQRLEAAQPGVVIYTEESPVDAVSQFQDGSFTYAMSSARQTLTQVPLNLTRFALPTFKTIEILNCDKPTGSWTTGVKWVFFNGEALWLEGPATEWFEPETRQTIRACHRILREHRDAFASDSPTPLVPTLRGGVFANAFSAPGKTVYTLYNARHRTLRGEMLEVPFREGMTFEDAWNGRAAEIRRVGAIAHVSIELGPQDVGCVVARGAGASGVRSP